MGWVSLASSKDMTNTFVLSAEASNRMQALLKAKRSDKGRATVVENVAYQIMAAMGHGNSKWTAEAKQGLKSGLWYIAITLELEQAA